MATPGSKHELAPKANNEMKTQLKYNLEDKSAKRYAGKGFEANNCPKRENLMNNSRFFINIVVIKNDLFEKQITFIAKGGIKFFFLKILKISINFNNLKTKKNFSDLYSEAPARRSF